MAWVAIEVIAPSRLHFGLLSFGQPAARQFGGAGVMIARPGLALRISPAERFVAVGPLAERVRAVVARCSEQGGEPTCRIEVLHAAAEHAGLGTGTQLALSVVAGLAAFRGDTPLDAPALASAAGRAARSAIGTHGFLQGGLLMESGKLAGETLAPLERRVELPADWRFALIIPSHERGLSGDEERLAFEQLPPVPPATTARLRDELADELFPAAAAGDFERFGESLYRYGHAAGMCFAPRQAGPFATPRVAELVAAIRELGVRGAGQSSWGPTVFALLENARAADIFCQEIGPLLVDGESVVVTEVNNTGATIRRMESAITP